MPLYIICGMLLPVLAMILIVRCFYPIPQRLNRMKMKQTHVE